MEYETHSSEETFNLGFEMAQKAHKGDIICLDGQLGAGKTVFAKGFAKGLGIKEEINISEYYGTMPLYHFDVYRLASGYDMDDIGYEEYFFGDGVCLIEWASMIDEIIPLTATKVEIKKYITKDFDYRKIIVTKRR